MEVQLSERLKKLPPYLFADLRRKIRAAKERGVKVVTLGIGDPDMPTPDPVVDEMIRAINDTDDPSRHRYGCDAPTVEFPQAVKNFYKRRWNVDLSDDQVVMTNGSKDAIAQFAMGILNPGDLGIALRRVIPHMPLGTHSQARALTRYPCSRRMISWWTLTPFPPRSAGWRRCYG